MISGPDPGAVARHDSAGTLSWRDVLRDAERQLRAAGTPDPSVSARRMLEEATGEEGASFVLCLDRRATVRSLAHFDRMLRRRLYGEPLQYVLGRWGFRMLDLMVDPRVLIPRPETEEVVERALGELDRLRARVEERLLTVVDLGTGSGAIALSIATERDWTEVWATDSSPGAVDVARANLAGLGRPASRVRLAEGDWFEALPPGLARRVDLVVSNPPYVAAGEALPDEVAEWEPLEALVSGPSGLEASRVILSKAVEWLQPHGVVVLELAPHQASSIVDLGTAVGFDVSISEDLTGRPRVATARRARSR